MNIFSFLTKKQTVSVLTKDTLNKKRGFTLVEMIVAVGLFSVVMLVAVAAILSIIGNNKRAQAINNVVNNLNFAIESMVRDMKTGYFYQCDTYSFPLDKNNYSSHLCTGTSPKETLAFFSTLTGAPTSVEYKFIPASGSGSSYVPGHIVKRQGNSGYVDLTSKTDVDILSMKMYVNSPQPGSGSQPGIFLVITGRANLGNDEVSEFGLQTYISQRVLNL